MTPGTKRNGKIDEQIEETFPASDPPSFMGGEVLGAPKGRKTPAKPHAQLLHRHKPVKKTKPAAKKKRTAKKKPSAKKKKRATKKKAPR